MGAAAISHRHQGQSRRVLAEVVASKPRRCTLLQVFGHSAVTCSCVRPLPRCLPQSRAAARSSPSASMATCFARCSSKSSDFLENATRPMTQTTPKHDDQTRRPDTEQMRFPDASTPFETRSSTRFATLFKDTIRHLLEALPRRSASCASKRSSTLIRTPFKTRSRRPQSAVRRSSRSSSTAVRRPYDASKRLLGACTHICIYVYIYIYICTPRTDVCACARSMLTRFPLLSAGFVSDKG